MCMMSRIKNQLCTVWYIAVVMVFVVLLDILLMPIIYCKAEGFGIIYTTEVDNNTSIYCFDENYIQVKCLPLSYSNISNDGYMNSCIIDGVVYLNPKGATERLDCGKIISLDLQSMNITEYDFGRVNIVSHCADESYICTTSNLNGIGYLDRYDKHTGKIESIEIKNIVFDSVLISDGEVYALGFDEDSIYSLFYINFSEGCLTELVKLDMDKIPCFLVQYNGEILFAYDRTLCFYNIDTDTVNEYTLSFNNAFNLLIHDDLLYIGYTDLFSLDSSVIEVIDLREMQPISVISHPNACLQMEVGNDTDCSLYILDYDSLSQYKMNENREYSLYRTFPVGMEDDSYVGGFFLIQ